MDTLRTLRNLDKDDVLGALGLQTRRSVAEYVLPVLGVFGAGLLVGVGVGMLAAPRSGRELRDELGRQANNARDRARNAVNNAINTAEQEVTSAQH